MTAEEIIFIVGGLLAGYWIVMAMLDKITETSAKTVAESNKETFITQEKMFHEMPDKGNNSYDENYIPANWFKILEIAESASSEQIRVAYKQKISQYHPDKVSQMGSEIRDLAAYKSREINAAHDYALKLRQEL
ncbi:J domain-containing protein [Sulfurirhabdus autotrophica]|uniref:DnaJ-like protein n=1 Tax=Sulfurirhabdus autotrophica TaxID=1706046 RepID=A0A4R3XYC8_9PROT|nr:J domain-containing protein [Sulfurirhabdus autotrophica]TCV84082.1 DnaJ-like protein [Sulfurirhabdus autotrophica]